MSVMATTRSAATSKVDSELLQRLRDSSPEKSEAELLERLAVLNEAKEATARAREAFADVPSEEIEREAERLVMESRREKRKLAAERAAAERKSA
jgi:hypothetical protein